MGNDWNSFMQSKPVRVLLYGLCVVCCAFYALGAVMDLVSPSEATAMLAQTMGQTGFVIMTVVRFLVCVWAAVAFGRLVVKTSKEQ